MGFYEFSQNNSGGSFDVDNKVCHRLFIEAPNAEAANDIAESLGVYFDGFGDCPCCGNRWYEADEYNLEEFPKDYGDEVFVDIEQYAQFLADKYGWTTPDCRIYYANGAVKEIFTQKGE